MEDSMLIEILKEMQKKYQCIVEIERITREMGDSLSRNDRTSVQILLGMRQEEMDNSDICDRNINCLISALLPRERAFVQAWIKGNEDPKADSPAAVRLVEKGNSIRIALKRTLEVDRHISTRLAGKDSFYQ
ncbi:hypothetical protein AALB39_24350 [Lachnospiraceae bacterium 54-53]